jgi:hypothetical protein
VHWHKEDVDPEPTYLGLLDHPEEALEIFLPAIDIPEGIKEEDWVNHLFAAHILILEICSLATK